MFVCVCKRIANYLLLRNFFSVCTGTREREYIRAVCAYVSVCMGVCVSAAYSTWLGPATHAAFAVHTILWFFPCLCMWLYVLVFRLMAATFHTGRAKTTNDTHTHLMRMTCCCSHWCCCWMPFLPCNTIASSIVRWKIVNRRKQSNPHSEPFLWCLILISVEISINCMNANKATWSGEMFIFLGIDTSQIMMTLQCSWIISNREMENIRLFWNYVDVVVTEALKRTWID